MSHWVSTCLNFDVGFGAYLFPVTPRERFLSCLHPPPPTPPCFAHKASLCGRRYLRAMCRVDGWRNASLTMALVAVIVPLSVLAARATRCSCAVVVVVALWCDHFVVLLGTSEPLLPGVNSVPNHCQQDGAWFLPTVFFSPFFFAESVRPLSQSIDKND